MPIRLSAPRTPHTMNRREDAVSDKRSRGESVTGPAVRAGPGTWVPVAVSVRRATVAIAVLRTAVTRRAASLAGWYGEQLGGRAARLFRKVEIAERLAVGIPPACSSTDQGGRKRRHCRPGFANKAGQFYYHQLKGRAHETSTHCSDINCARWNSPCAAGSDIGPARSYPRREASDHGCGCAIATQSRVSKIPLGKVSGSSYRELGQLLRDRGRSES